MERRVSFIKLSIISAVSLILAAGTGLYAFSSESGSSAPVIKKKRVIVYVNKKGKKFHNAGCLKLRPGKRSMTRREALRRNFKPCSKCKGKPVVVKKKVVVVATRCKGLTKRGFRCKRKTKHISGYCSAHRR